MVCESSKDAKAVRTMTEMSKEDRNNPMSFTVEISFSQGHPPGPN